MKIIRNGVEYELTWSEIFDAHREYERECFIEDIKAKAEEMEVDLTNRDMDEIVDLAMHSYNNDDYLWESYWNDIQYAIEEA